MVHVAVSGDVCADFKHALDVKSSMVKTLSCKFAYMSTTIGERIKAERLAKGWTQQRLADEIARIKHEKISHAAVAQWESGESKSLKPDNLFATADALGLEPRYVAIGTGDKYAATKETYSGSAIRLALRFVREAEAKANGRFSEGDFSSLVLAVAEWVKDLDKELTAEDERRFQSMLVTLVTNLPRGVRALSPSSD